MKSSNNFCNQHNEPLSMDLKVLVRHYIQNHRSNSELKIFEKSSSFSEALEKASMAINDKGKRFDHQRRLPSESLKESKESLFKIMTLLNASKDFAELHDLIKKTLDEVCGVGELFYYDTALRLGAFLKLFPECVHLHRGTRDGAKALGLNWQANTLDPKIFPPPIQKLSPHEIEDFLCIYKKRLKGDSNGHA